MGCWSLSQLPLNEGWVNTPDKSAVYREVTWGQTIIRLARICSDLGRPPERQRGSTHREEQHANSMQKVPGMGIEPATLL